MKHHITRFALVSLIFSSCSVTYYKDSSIKQGVAGKVVQLTANTIPNSDTAEKTGNPVKRVLFIYQRTNLKQTVGDSPMFTDIKSAFVITTQANENGYFECKLPPGKYSIFTIERNNKFFGTPMGRDGEISAFEVTKNEVTTFNIAIKP